MTSEERKLKIAELRNKIVELQRELYSVVEDCEHQIIDTDAKCKHPEWGTGTAKCIICDEYFGWYCRKSPDHTCHYFTDDDNMVKLIDCTKVKITNVDHDKEYETDDCCLFCGLPDERK